LPQASADPVARRRVKPHDLRALPQPRFAVAGRAELSPKANRRPHIAPTPFSRGLQSRVRRGISTRSDAMMTRRLLNLLTLPSLLLCIAACVLWVRSYGLSDAIGFVRAGTRDQWVMLDSSRGSLWIGHTSSRPEADGNPHTGFFRRARPVPAASDDAHSWHTVAFVRDDPEGNLR